MKIKPYAYQKRIANLILSGKSVVVKAPTGGGKTAGALLPFTKAWEKNLFFPRKCIYAVPLRVLANQFYSDYYAPNNIFGFKKPLTAEIQTGQNPGDTRFEGNLIFTTIDQVLSSFLNIPYSLSTRSANLNAGAVASSYLILDEVHLFDGKTMLQTTFQMLKMLKGVVPFVLMTATWSDDMVKFFAKELDAEPIILKNRSLKSIPSQNGKIRVFHRVDRPLTELESIADILTLHYSQSEYRRTVIVCNSVKNAQKVARLLRSIVENETEVILFHSRFLKKDREDIEATLMREFGKDKSAYTLNDAILVTTQVCEVGVDITCRYLHTEISTAASVIQRAGRCARYSGETGDVYIYDLEVGKRGKKYGPYQEQRRVVDKSWVLLQGDSPFIEKPMTYDDEIRYVNLAHQEADKEIVEMLKDNGVSHFKMMYETIVSNKRNKTNQLIRDIRSVSVLVHPNPASITDPQDYETFNLPLPSTFEFFAYIRGFGKTKGLSWICRAGRVVEESDGVNTVKRFVFDEEVEDRDTLAELGLIVVNPEVVSYSREYGLEAVPPDEGDLFCSPLATKTGAKKQYQVYSYQRESLLEHVSRMVEAYESPFTLQSGKTALSLKDELAYAAHNLEARLGSKQGGFDNLVKLMIAFHDAGKMSSAWQSWAHKFEKEIIQLREDLPPIPEGYCFAHTDYNPQKSAERKVALSLQSLRPNHAVESAYMVSEWLPYVLSNKETAVRAILTAIVKHHSAETAGTCGDFESDELFVQHHLRNILDCLGYPQLPVNQKIKFKFGANQKVETRMIEPDADQLVLYFLLSRILRLTDQRSLENQNGAS